MPRPGVVIIGAGPAGSVAAERLAAAGVPVLVLERDFAAGKRNACGGGLAYAFKERLELPDEVVAETIFGARLIRGGRVVELRSREPKFISVKRSVFDAYLAERAARRGAEVRYGARVLAIDPRLRRITYEERRSGRRVELEAGMIIYADGVPTLAHAAHGIGYGPGEPAFLALAWELPRPPDTDDTLEFHLDPGGLPLGYYWIFPKGEVVNVGVGGLAEEMRGAMHGLLGRFVAERFGYREPPLLARAGYIPARAVARRLWGDGALVVGDAAGLVNPLTGGGLLYAVISGELAADVCREVHRQGPGGDWIGLRRYETALRRRPLYPWLRLMTAVHTRSVRRVRQGKASLVPPLLEAYFRFFRLIQPLLPRLT